MYHHLGLIGYLSLGEIHSQWYSRSSRIIRIEISYEYTRGIWAKMGFIHENHGYSHGSCMPLPSGKLTELWKITIFNGKTNYKWQFSIAMLNYQRVFPLIPWNMGEPQRGLQVCHVCAVGNGFVTASTGSPQLQWPRGGRVAYFTRLFFFHTMRLWCENITNNNEDNNIYIWWGYIYIMI